MSNPSTVPPIAARTAAAMCSDDYLGMPALDDPSWQGASDASRSCIWEQWAFCYNDETRSVQAQHEDGEGFTSYRMGDWEAL